MLVWLALIAQDAEIGAITDFRRALADADDDVEAVAALQKLSPLPHARVTTELASCLGQRGDAFRIAAARVLAERKGDAAAAEALAKAVLHQESETVKLELLGAFAQTKCKAAAKRLIPHLRERRNVKLAAAAIAAARDLDSDEFIEPLVQTLRELETTKDAVRKEACLKPTQEALAAITGQPLTTATEFHSWYKSQVTSGP